MTLPWIIGSAALGLLAGPWIRSCAIFYSAAPYSAAFDSTGSDSTGFEPDRGAGADAEPGQPRRPACPGCARPVLPARRPWASPLPVTGLLLTGLPLTGLPLTGRCRACRARIGPYPLLPEFMAGAAMAVAAARATSAWELAALAWLILLAVPLIFIDIAVHRLPNPLTGAAGAGVLVLLAVAAFTGHHPGSPGLIRAVLGAAALAGFYLVLWLIRPGGMGLGDVKLAVSVGLVLAWTSWQALFAATFLTFILAAGCGMVIIATRKSGRGTQLPLGPFMLAAALAAIAFLPPV